MQYKDLLRGTVLLVAIEATGLAAISAVTINSTGDDKLAALSLGWWLIAIVGGVWLGRPSRTAEVLRGPLAAAKTSTQLPAESPVRIALARLWPIALFAILAGARRAVPPAGPGDRHRLRARCRAPPGATARRRSPRSRSATGSASTSSTARPSTRSS